MDTLEYGDLQVKLGNINKNPAGYYTRLDRESPPTTYETRAQRQARENAGRHRQRERQEAQRLQDAYDEYRKQEIEHYIAEELTGEGRDKLIRLELDECRRKYPDLPKGTIDEMVPRGVRRRIWRAHQTCHLRGIPRTGAVTLLIETSYRLGEHSIEHERG
jgi:hypothetical protein